MKPFHKPIARHQRTAASSIAPKKRMQTVRWLTLLALVAILPGCGERAQDFYPGYAEADYVRLASPIAGNLAKLYLKRGDKVAANAPAFVLEQESERAAHEEAQARVERAHAVLANLKKGKRPDEIAALQAQLAQGQAALRLSMAELARQEQLLAAGFISPARIDEARTTVARDRNRVHELQAQLRIARLGARSDEIDAAMRDLSAAQAQLAQANWALEQKTRHVPVNAEVVDILFREGELVPAGSPVVTLLPPQNIKARFFVPEPVLGTLRLGQEVVIRCDGCGAPILGKISYISPEAEYTSPLIYSKENRSTLVFMIEARPVPDGARRLHPGQPLEVRFPVPARSGQ
ncbi:MAG TPA: HlyD family efflux transporter periplasmic adaptor subunit [Burkholderiaceae bacterium]|nr:HlyD family efflux transporter periplasmic adaptor subunit [Burkholderiaceae bacterium]